MTKRPVETLEAVSQARLCAWLGCQPKVLLEWEAAGMPRLPDGRYEPGAALRWVKARWLEERRGSHSKRTEAQERKDRAVAALKEMELAQRRGELIPVGLVKSEWGRLTEGFKQVLLGLPWRLAPRLERRDAKAIAAELDESLRRAIDDMRSRYVSGEPVQAGKAKAKRKAKAKTGAKAGTKRK